MKDGRRRQSSDCERKAKVVFAFVYHIQRRVRQKKGLVVELASKQERKPVLLSSIEERKVHFLEELLTFQALHMDRHGHEHVQMEQLVDELVMDKWLKGANFMA